MLFVRLFVGMFINLCVCWWSERCDDPTVKALMFFVLLCFSYICCCVFFVCLFVFYVLCLKSVCLLLGGVRDAMILR